MARSGPQKLTTTSAIVDAALAPRGNDCESLGRPRRCAGFQASVPHAIVRPVTVALRWILLLSALAACVLPPTQMTVVADTDAPLDRAPTVRFTLRTTGAAETPRQPDLVITRGGAAGTVTLPATFGLTPGDGRPRDLGATLTVEASLEAGGPSQPAIVWRRRARFAFRPNAGQLIPLFLSVRCGERSTRCTRTAADECTVSAYCDERGETCGDRGECESIDVRPLPTDAGFSFDVLRSTDAAPDVVVPDTIVGPDTIVDRDATVDATMDATVDATVDTVTDVRNDGAADAPDAVDAVDVPPFLDAPMGGGLFGIWVPMSNMFTIPAGVTRVYVRAWGGGGGSAFPTGSSALPGAGGAAAAIIDVIPGERLDLVVGGPGRTPTSPATGGAGGTPGGGGAGGAGGTGMSAGGGGGGRTTVSRAGVLLLVAGGGGGAAGGGGPACVAGAGGGLVGEAGGAGDAAAGRGGSQSAGGPGGVGRAPSPGGTAGSVGLGGAGGAGVLHGGGGGGGGYYGGGGGAAAAMAMIPGGGGGGSGFASVAGGSIITGVGATPPNASDPRRDVSGNPNEAGGVIITY